MDRYTMNILREEKGINGVKIIPRVLNKPQERANKPLIPEPYKKVRPLEIDPITGLTRQTVETGKDLRRHNSTGQPIEDYSIAGEGRSEIVIREVQNSIEGMKEYALIRLPAPKKEKTSKFSMKKRETKPGAATVYYDVMYVYSEGIDIEKMVEDAEYSREVISLLSEQRLQQKQEASEQLGTDVVYIGTVTKGDKGYVKSGIRDYSTAVAGIASKLDELKKKAYKPYEEKIKQEEDEEIAINTKQEIVQLAPEKMDIVFQVLVRELNHEGRTKLIAAFMSELGEKEFVKLLKTVLAHRNNDQIDVEHKDHKDDGEFYEW